MIRNLFAAFLLVAALLMPAAGHGSNPDEITPVPYALADGTGLTGYLSLPPGHQQGRKYPAILLIHGGKGIPQTRPGSPAETFLKSKPVQEHLRPHYVVFAAEYYSDYFGDRREFDSLAAALKALAALPQVDPGKIAALGVSHGGYLALMCAVHPAISPKPKIAVSVSGVVDVASFAEHIHRLGTKGRLEAPPDPGNYATGKVAQALGWPPGRDSQTRERYARLSVLSYIRDLSAAVLVIHGTEDNLVPFTQAEELREALQQRRKNFEFVEIPTGKIGGHFIFFTSKTVWERIDAFLSRHL